MYYNPFVCLCFSPEFFSDLYEKFQVATTYDTNVEYQISCFYCNLFLNYADNRHTDLHTDTHRPNAKNVIF